MFPLHKKVPRRVLSSVPVVLLLVSSDVICTPKHFCAYSVAYVAKRLQDSLN